VKDGAEYDDYEVSWMDLATTAEHRVPSRA
jgi:hypothetical protein